MYHVQFLSSTYFHRYHAVSIRRIRKVHLTVPNFSVMEAILVSKIKIQLKLTWLIMLYEIFFKK